MDHSSPSPLPTAAASMASSGVAVAGCMTATQVSLIIAAIGALCALVSTGITIFRFVEERKFRRLARGYLPLRAELGEKNRDLS